MRTSQKLAYPQLNLPQSVETRVFRAIQQVLIADQVFAPVCNVFVQLDGSQWDTAEPNYSLCPYCAIGPFPTESNWITELQHYAPLTLRVQLAVQGTLFDNIGNFWGAMRDAFFKIPAMQYLTAAGVLKPTVTVNAYGITPEDKDGNRMLVADGTIKFGIFIPTPT
jgi:hypothetical protein